MSCIYEGFRVFSFSENMEFNQKNLNLNLIINKENGKEKCHNAIVYGIDYFGTSNFNGNKTNDILTVSSSFYDNKIILWKFN